MNANAKTIAADYVVAPLFAYFAISGALVVARKIRSRKAPKVAA